MMKPLSPRNRSSIKEMVRRVDRVVGDLNILLVVIAIGLATLDVTFLLTQKIVDHLPPVTRVTYNAASPPSN
jgi:hypothetical protein